MSLNDSGYSGDFSPLKKEHSLRDCTNHFLMKFPKDSESTSLVVDKDISLCAAIRNQQPSTEFENLLVGAKIYSNLGATMWVNPSLLPCRFIEKDSEIQSIEYNGKEKIYQKNIPPRSTEMIGERVSVFFISNMTEDRRRRTNFTYSKYDAVKNWNYICVTAYPGQTFRESLKQDGRFKDELMDRLKLNRKEKGMVGPQIQLKKKVENYEEVVLVVTVSKAPRQTGPSVESYPSVKLRSDDTLLSDAPTEPVPEMAGKEARSPSREKLAKQLWEENAVYVYPAKVEDLTLEQLHARRQACLRARAWSTLVGPQGGRKKYEKTISQVATQQYANQDVVARPVIFSKELCRLYDSVGQLKCGSVTATCFLVGDDVIATNYHVIDLIEKARRASVPGDHSTVSVCFDYEDEERRQELQANTYKLLPLTHSKNILSKEKDYAFLHLERKVEPRIRRLGPNITRFVPERGTVCIVGHPSGKPKVEEMCPILPLDDNRRSSQFKTRLAIKGSQNSRDKLVLQMYRQKSLMTYDVGSMDGGSSGAPVFNMRCQIVALHTLGFALDETGNNSNSSVEVGVTFDAIVADLERKGHFEFVQKLFPNVSVEDMDGDWDF